MRESIRSFWSALIIANIWLANDKGIYVAIVWGVITIIAGGIVVLENKWNKTHKEDKKE